MIDTILWDIDGTLMDFKASEKNAIKKAFSDFAIDITDDEISLYSDINDSCWKRMERGEITRERVFTLRFEEFFEKVGYFCDIEKLNENYLTYLGQMFVIQDNSYEILKSLKGKVRQYIVTNGHVKPQTMKVKDSGFAEIIDGLFISGELGCQKPSKEFFLKCFEKIGEVNKEKTIIIGDSLSSDIKGGNNAGILTCWYNPEGMVNKTDAVVNFEIKSLSEVYEIIK